MSTDTEREELIETVRNIARRISPGDGAYLLEAADMLEIAPADSKCGEMEARARQVDKEHQLRLAQLRPPPAQQALREALELLEEIIPGYGVPMSDRISGVIERMEAASKPEQQAQADKACGEPMAVISATSNGYLLTWSGPPLPPGEYQFITMQSHREAMAKAHADLRKANSNAIGQPGSSWKHVKQVSASHAAQEAAKPEQQTQPCQESRGGASACKNRRQCWEPCGELGKSEAHVKVYDYNEQHAQAGEPRWAENERNAHLFIVADRAEWLANNFNGTQEHYDEVTQKLRDYAALVLAVREAIAKKDAALKACIELANSIDQQVDLSRYHSAPPNQTLLDDLRAVLKQAQEALK